MLQDLCNSIGLDEKTPLQLLQYMKGQFGQNTMSEELLQRLWILKLPHHTV